MKDNNVAKRHVPRYMPPFPAPRKGAHGADRWPDAADPHKGVRREAAKRRGVLLEPAGMWVFAIAWGALLYLALTIAAHGGMTW